MGFDKICLHPRADWYNTFMPSPRQRFGQQGERWAAAYLQAQGYRVVARNVRTPYGEIDLIAQDDRGLVFVEVKARRGRGPFRPEDRVDARKRRRLWAAAQHWLAEHYTDADEPPWRLDVIALEWFGPGAPRVTHWQDIPWDDDAG